MNQLLIMAHAPLASALRDCALHVFPDAQAAIWVLDVQAHQSSDETLAAARVIRGQLGDSVLVLTDIFGATPCNVAQRLVDGVSSKLIAGVNLPMLLRCLTYRHETLDTLVTRAMAGGTQGVMQVAVSAPQKQTLRPHDPNDRHHQQ